VPFTGDVVVRELRDDDGSRWQLVEPLSYMGRDQLFEVAAGFTTDFASVPQALTWLVPRYGRYTKAAILHDFLWQRCREGRFDWADADGILRRAMRELDVPFLRRWLMWGAVRLAGIVTRSPSSLWTQGGAALAALVVVTTLGIAYVAVPLAVVVAFTVVFAAAEAVVWVGLKAASRRVTAHKKVNRPRLMLPR
jgi:Protein of unknown function (DUF1353)